MKILRPALVALLAWHVTPVVADEYQDAISKAFPGFRALSPVDIDLQGINRDIYDRVKDSPGLIVGKFNSDKIPDFAALIRTEKKKQYVHKDRGKIVAKYDYYEGYLVICYGAGARKYNCEKLEESPMHFREPSFEFLMKIPPGRETCLELIRFRPPRPKPDPNLGFDPGEMRNKESFAQIEFNTDAIAVLPSETLEFYVSQADGTYLHCALNQ